MEVVYGSVGRSVFGSVWGGKGELGWECKLSFRLDTQKPLRSRSKW